MRCAFALLLVVLGGWTASHFVRGTLSIIAGADRPADGRPGVGPCRIFRVSNAGGGVGVSCDPVEAGQFYPPRRWERFGVAPLSIDEVFASPHWVGPDVLGWAGFLPFWLLALPPGAAFAWCLWRRWRARKHPPGFPVVA